MFIPINVSYGTPTDPFHMEFKRRTGYFSMGRYHFHQQYEIYYLVSGERKYFIKDQMYTIRQVDLILIDSNDVHKTFDTDVPGHERIVAYYGPHFFDRYFPEDSIWMLEPFKGYPVLHLSAKERQLVEAMFSSLLDEITNRPPGYELRLRHLAVDLLLYIYRFAKARNSLPCEVSSGSVVKQKMTEISRYISRHYEQDLTLEAVSKRFYISPSYLSRVFKEVTGFNFTDYVSMIRIREAQRLLRETDLKILDISVQVGFNNFSHFGKVFKRVVSISPRDYRLKYR